MKLQLLATNFLEYFLFLFFNFSLQDPGGKMNADPCRSWSTALLLIIETIGDGNYKDLPWNSSCLGRSGFSENSWAWQPIWREKRLRIKTKKYQVLIHLMEKLKYPNVKHFVTINGKSLTCLSAMIGWVPSALMKNTHLSAMVGWVITALMPPVISSRTLIVSVPIRLWYLMDEN